MIDPASPRPRYAMEPAFDAVELRTFEAAHFLLYGTDYSLWHYVPEMRERIAAGERLPFARLLKPDPYDEDPSYVPAITATDEDNYNRLLRQHLADDDESRAATLYLDSRQMLQPLRHAAQVLQEAALRGEITVLGRRSPDGPLIPIPVPAWLDRGWLQLGTGVLYRQRQAPMRDMEWFDLTFDRREVDRLRSAGWHNITPPAMPPPEVRPTYKAYATKGENLKRALEAAGADETISKARIIAAVAALYLSDYGADAHPKGLAGLTASLEGQLGGEWPRDELIKRAKRAGWQG